MTHTSDRARWIAVITGLLYAQCAADLAAEVDSARADLQSADASAVTGPRQQSGWNALVSWDAIPTFKQSTTRMFTSRERPNSGIWIPYDAGNKDFNNFIAVCGLKPVIGYQYVDNVLWNCKPGEQGYLLAAADGPGFISRIALGVGSLDPFAQNANGVAVQTHPTTERIRIYVDDGRVPIYDGTWLDWDRATTAPFQAPLAGFSSGIMLNYVPISYSRNVRVFADNLIAPFVSYYYQVTTHTSEPTARFNAIELTSAAAQADLASVIAASHDAPGAERWYDDSITLPSSTASAVWERNQAGTINRLTISLDAAAAPQILSQIALRLSWDGESTPAIDTSLAEFFGARLGVAEFETWPMHVRKVGDRFELTVTLPMPFTSRAKLELVNAAEATLEDLRVRIDGVNTTPQAPFGRLRTSRQTRARPRAGERFVLADLTGPGKYVGTLMYMIGGPYPLGVLPGPSPLNFLEGDDKLEVDGVVSDGTGTEETFNGGWYFSEGRYNGALSALIHMKQEASRGEIAAVRWNVLHDSLDFRSRFKLSYEYGANHPETAFEYVAVGFYYK